MEFVGYFILTLLGAAIIYGYAKVIFTAYFQAKRQHTKEVLTDLKKETCNGENRH